MPSLTPQDSPLARARRSRKADAPTGAATTQTVCHDTAKFAPTRSTRGRSRLALRPAERDTLRRLLTEKYEYVDHEFFVLPEEESYDKVFIEPEPLPLPDVSWYHRLMDPSTPGSSGGSGSSGGVDPASLLKNPKGSVVLTVAQERVLFSQFNYCRRQVCLRRDQLLAAPAESGKPLTRVQKDRIEREALDWHLRADMLRKQIADTNLALVLAMAKRTRIFPGDFADLISEGNMALLRAADKFDVGRGFKFSTYACRAILKAFSRQGIKLSKHRQMFPMDFDPKLERSNYQSEKNAAHEDECADEVRRIVADNRAELSDVERTVVAARFNVGPGAQPTPVIDKPVFRLDPPTTPDPAKDTDGFELPQSLQDRAADAKPLTLEQVGKLIGVTKERVRQIQNKALEKIRLTLEEDYLG